MNTEGPLSQKVQVVVERTDSGFSAFAGAHGVYTTAKNVPELYEQLIDALNLA